MASEGDIGLLVPGTVREVMEGWRDSIHPLSSGVGSLWCILQALQAKDSALMQAMRRYCVYRSVSLRVGGAGIGDPRRHVSFKLGDVSVATLTLCGHGSPSRSPIHHGSLQQDCNYCPKILDIRFAAALVEREMSRYPVARPAAATGRAGGITATKLITAKGAAGSGWVA